MAIKLFGSSITSVYKSVASTVSKTVSKVSGGSSSKSSSTNSKSSSSGNKTSASSNSKSSSSGNKTSASSNSKSSSSGNKTSASSNSKSSSSGNRTSATATSKTVSSNGSSGSKQSTTTKYVTNAAAIYNASGKKVSTPSSVSTGRPDQSYVTQKKVSATSSQKTTGNSSSVKTTNAKAKTTASTVSKTTNSKSPLSISNGRPEQSYATQKKVSTTYNQKTTANSSKQAKLPVPVAQKAPLVTKTTKSKKEQSEASYSNNRPKQSYTHVVAYTPTASREGAGQMFYMSKTDPKGAKAGASFATSCIPYVGDAKDIQEAITGKDLITGKKLTGGERALTITAAVLPVVSGPMLNGAVKGSKVAVKEAPDAVRGVEKLIKKNAPKVKKVANKTDVAEDTAKVMKKKAVEKVKDAKTKEITQQVKGNSGFKQRPSWRQSEIDMAKDYPDFTEQKSFINGEQCTYGKKGSVRPDYYKEGVSIEIKNYKIDTASGRSNLVRNIEKQYLKRVDGLPEGTKQTVIIDIRGQNIDEEKMDLLYDNIMHRTNNKVDILFKK